jgi:hypothetical protein
MSSSVWQDIQKIFLNLQKNIVRFHSKDAPTASTTIIFFSQSPFCTDALQMKVVMSLLSDAHAS